MEGSKYSSAPKPQCRLSDPANPHKLCRRPDPPLSICFACKGQHLEDKRYYYYCTTCDLEFHRGCHYFPPQIRHPFHLLHPLNLTFLNPKFDSSEIPIDWKSNSSNSEDYDFNDAYEDENFSTSDGNHVICNYCQRHLQNKEEDEDIYYHCSICNFSLHCGCIMKPPPLTIENLKSHDHTLTLFPRPVPLPCNACGFPLDSIWDHVYSCLLCNYMVHRKCIYLPRVIKITRHQHRLSHTSSVVPSDHEFSCGVCRKTVNANYGQYSCNKGCHYAVHSKCATKNEVWDGKDLEGVPEEEEEDVEPFVRIDKETIQHFSHDHHYLKIHGNGNHENKFCQACILPITVSDRFYTCIRCDFVLHGACASLPRKKYHPIHKHPLILVHPFSPSTYEVGHEYPSEGFFKCNGCDRDGCGFVYKCVGEKYCDFQLDARCASLPDPTIHPHDHPLFFNCTEGECLGCKLKRYYSRKYLECVKCNSFLCLQCATFPCVAHYKHDKHPLTLCYGEEETRDVQYWYEICETTLDATKWFYTCNSCRVTLHVTCLLGKDIYMKPNHIIKIDDENVDIARNSGNTRPVRYRCRRRCIYNLVFKWLDLIFCSMSCLLKSKRERGMIRRMYGKIKVKGLTRPAT